MASDAYKANYAQNLDLMMMQIQSEGQTGQDLTGVSEEQTITGSSTTIIPPTTDEERSDN